MFGRVRRFRNFFKKEPMPFHIKADNGEYEIFLRYKSVSRSMVLKTFEAVRKRLPGQPDFEDVEKNQIVIPKNMLGLLTKKYKKDVKAMESDIRKNKKADFKIYTIEVSSCILTKNKAGNYDIAVTIKGICNEGAEK